MEGQNFALIPPYIFYLYTREEMYGGEPHKVGYQKKGDSEIETNPLDLTSPITSIMTRANKQKGQQTKKITPGPTPTNSPVLPRAETPTQPEEWEGPRVPRHTLMQPFTAMRIPRYSPRDKEDKGDGEVISKLQLLKQTLCTAKLSFEKVFAPGPGKDVRIANKLLKAEDPYSVIPRHIQGEYGGQCVNNSFMKFMEMFDGLAVGKRKRVFFNAELPGGSIAAWNHYATTRKWGEYQWWASSLLPTPTNGAFDDLYGLLSGNRDKWLMGGQWGDGDATKLENIDRWVKFMGEGGIDLYTHDAGRDASSDYNNQERINSSLHMGCTLTGLRLLQKGGVFIGKQYTCLEPFTMSILLAMSACFGKLYLVKPISSRDRNSETYVVGVDYFGPDHPVAARLIRKMTKALSTEDIDTPLLGIHWDSFSVREIARFNELMVQKQVKAINHFCASYEKHGMSWGAFNQYNYSLTSLHTKIKDYWIRDNHILTMPCGKWFRQGEAVLPTPILTR